MGGGGYDQMGRDGEGNPTDAQTGMTRNNLIWNGFLTFLVLAVIALAIWALVLVRARVCACAHAL